MFMYMINVRATKGAGPDLFCIAFVLLAQGFEKVHIHLWLWRSGFHSALVTTRCSCWGALDFAHD